MSDLITPAPVDPEAFSNRALKVPPPDVWTTKTIAHWDFSGRIIGRDTPSALCGGFSETATTQARLSRILAMGPVVRALPNGPGVWVDSVMRQIQAMVRDIANSSPKFPRQREALQAKYERLVIETEIEMENVIRTFLGGEKKQFENLTARANHSVGAGALPQTPIKGEDKPAPWTAEAWIAKIRARGVWIETSPGLTGLIFRGAGALSPADIEILQDKRAELESYVAANPGVAGPPAPPPPFLPPAAPIEPVAATIPPPPPPALPAGLPAASDEPDEAMATPEIPGGLGTFVTTADGKVMTAASAAERDKPKRRHPFAAAARLPNR